MALGMAGVVCPSRESNHPALASASAASPIQGGGCLRTSFTDAVLHSSPKGRCSQLIPALPQLVLSRMCSSMRVNISDAPLNMSEKSPPI